LNYLLDTDICSAHLKQRSGLMHRFVQHSGRMAISSISLAELYAWAYKPEDPTIRLKSIGDFVSDVAVLDFDIHCAQQLGRLRSAELKSGKLSQLTDLMIACVALTHDLTLVTHNTQDFRNIPNLRLEDWIST